MWCQLLCTVLKTDMKTCQWQILRMCNTSLTIIIQKVLRLAHTRFIVLGHAELIWSSRLVQNIYPVTPLSASCNLFINVLNFIVLSMTTSRPSARA